MRSILIAAVALMLTACASQPKTCEQERAELEKSSAAAYNTRSVAGAKLEANSFFTMDQWIARERIAQLNGRIASYNERCGKSI